MVHIRNVSGGMVGLVTASMMFAAKYADEKQQKKEEKNG